MPRRVSSGHDEAERLTLTIYIDITRNAAVLDQENAIGKGHGLCDIVSDQDRGVALLAPDPFEQPLHRNPRQGIERAERFVKRKQSRATDQRPCQRHTLFLPAGKNRRPLRPLVGKADLGQRLLGPRQSIRRFSLAAEADLDIRKNPCPRQQARLLKHHAHVIRLRSLAETDAAGIDVLEPRDQAQQRALAAAAAADDGDELTRGNVQIDTTQHLMVAERLPKAANGQRKPA